MLGPEHPDTLARIGHLALCLSQTGRLDEAEKLQREVLAIQTRVHAEPDALAISKYNLACIAVLRKDPAGAIALLQEAVAHGLPTDFALQLGNDPDLAPLRGDPAFQELLAEARRRSGK